MLDGLVLDAPVSRVRPDLKTVTNVLLCGIEGLRDRMIPLHVLSGRDAGMPQCAVHSRLH